MNLEESIVVKTTSGLGNQLFQLANGMEQARRLDIPLICDRFGNDGKTDRSFALEPLDDGCEFRSTPEYSFVDGLNDLIHFHELSEFKFDKSIFEIHPGTLLSGYFQHPSYSLNSIPRLLSSLTRLSPAKRQLDSVHIHVRRGDINSNPYLRRKMGVLDIDYYIKALSLLDEMGVDTRKIQVFSDSPLEALRLFSTVFYNKQVVLADNHKEPLSSLLELSTTLSLVGANSTFSWWAARLAEFINPQANIVFPLGMLRNIPESKVLLPSNWALIKPKWKLR